LVIYRGIYLPTEQIADADPINFYLQKLYRLFLPEVAKIGFRSLLLLSFLYLSLNIILSRHAAAIVPVAVRNKQELP